MLPAGSAAFVGIRAYAELELMTEQSAHMQAVMARAQAELQALPANLPLASQELAAVELALILEMLRDVEGWAQLFGVKVVEAG